MILRFSITSFSAAFILLAKFTLFTLCVSTKGFLLSFSFTVIVSYTDTRIGIARLRLLILEVIITLIIKVPIISTFGRPLRNIVVVLTLLSFSRRVIAYNMLPCKVYSLMSTLM